MRDAAMKSDLTDVTVHRHAITDKAIRVSDTGEEAKAVWLPLSQIELRPLAGNRSQVVVTLPEWLAIEKGLV